jgi:hypothetical protein
MMWRSFMGRKFLPRVGIPAVLILIALLPGSGRCEPLSSREKSTAILDGAFWDILKDVCEARFGRLSCSFEIAGSLVVTIDSGPGLDLNWFNVGTRCQPNFGEWHTRLWDPRFHPIIEPSSREERELAKYSRQLDAIQAVAVYRRVEEILHQSNLPETRSETRLGPIRNIALIPASLEWMEEVLEDREGSCVFGGSGLFVGVNSDAGLQGEIIRNVRTFELTHPSTVPEYSPTQDPPAFFFRMGVGLYRLQ